MSNIDVTNREQYPGFDIPELSPPVADASVKGITFSLGDLNVTTEMSKIPLFHAEDLAALANTDGTIELVWRLSDFGMDSKIRGTNIATTAQTATTYEGSHGVGGWAGLFQFSLNNVSPSFDNSSGRINIGADSSLKGRCNQGWKTPAANGTIQTDGRLLNDPSTAEQMSSCGFWPTELNIMRGVVTSQDNGAGKPFADMPALDGVAGQTYSTAEHYMNYVSKELTGSTGGAGLFENLKSIVNHMIKETGAGAGTDVAGVQFKIWSAIHSILTAPLNKDSTDAGAGNNIATKLVKAMLSDDGGSSGNSLSDAERTQLRNRFFAEHGDTTAGKTFKRFGPSGGLCAGVLDGVTFTGAPFDTWIDVPLAHADVIEFNLVLQGATNTATDVVATDEIGGQGTATEVNNSNGATRFGDFLPGANDIREVKYRVKIHLEGVDTRPL